MFVLSIVWFVHFYFDAGRLWLAYAVIGLRLARAGAEFPDRRERQLPRSLRAGPAAALGRRRRCRGRSASPIRGPSCRRSATCCSSRSSSMPRSRCGAGAGRWHVAARLSSVAVSLSASSTAAGFAALVVTGRGPRTHHRHARLLHRRSGDGLRAGLGPDRRSAAGGAAARQRAALPRGRRSGSERDPPGRRQGHDHAGERAGRGRVRLPACGTRREAGRNADSGALSRPARRAAGRLRQGSAGAGDGGRARAGRVPQGWRRNSGGSHAQSDVDEGWVVRAGVGRRHHRAQARSGQRPASATSSRTCRGSRCWASCPDRSRTNSTSR